MEFRAERDDFVDAITWVARAAGTRTTLPAAAALHLSLDGNELTVTGTNLDLTHRTTIEVNGTADGVALIPASHLANVARTLPKSAVTAAVDGDKVRVTCGRTNVSLRTIDEADYPNDPCGIDTLTDTKHAADGASFAKLLTQVARATSSLDARPALGGVQIAASDGQLTAAATDSYRLAVRQLTWDGPDTDALVPRATIDEVKRVAGSASSVAVAFTDQQARFEIDERVVATRLIDATFPDWKTLLPTEFVADLYVERAAFHEVVKRVAVVAEAEAATAPIVADIADGETVVRSAARSDAVGRSEEAVDCSLDGDPGDLSIGFNARYLLDGLDGVTSEKVRVRVQDGLKPIVLTATPDDDADADGSPVDDYTYLLMPVRIES